MLILFIGKLKHEYIAAHFPAHVSVLGQVTAVRGRGEEDVEFIIADDGAVRPRLAGPVSCRVGLEADLGLELTFVGAVEYGVLIDGSQRLVQGYV